MPSAVREDTYKVRTTLDPTLSIPATKRGVPLPPKPAPSQNLSRNHRNRHRESILQWTAQCSLLTARTGAQFWKVVRRMTDDKKRPSEVSVDQLATEFHKRQSSLGEKPAYFNEKARQQHILTSQAIPSRTTDPTPHLFFDRPILEHEVMEVKTRLRKHLTTATGLDQVAYRTIISIPNDVVAVLFQACLDSCDSPHKWLFTELIGLLKKGKDPKDPQSYRVIGLESCFLKALTLLFDIRLGNWADLSQVVPDSQNGFRKGHRTHDNSFVLHVARDKAHAQNQTLWVTFLDLKNAYPWTDLPTLWSKLWCLGVGGKFFDWMRRTYSEMKYVVHHEGLYSKDFMLPVGLLTGDSVSPGLWKIFFSDLPKYMPDNAATDIVLYKRPMSHLEQADDAVAFAIRPAALQIKLDGFERLCGDSSAVVSKTKSECMVLGKPPRTGASQPSFYMGGVLLPSTTSFTYVGVGFDSVNNRKMFFESHYKTRVRKAKNVACSIFSMRRQIGFVPVLQGRRLYMARVDPHLTFGCEIVIDVNNSLLASLEKVQVYFLRRLLGVHRRSPVAPLFTETGTIPIRYRRLSLALRYLAYLLALDTSRPAFSALRECMVLLDAGNDCWLKDLKDTLARDPIRIAVENKDFASKDRVEFLANQVLAVGWENLLDDIHASSKLSLLKSRHPRLRLNNGKAFKVPEIQNYLLVPIDRHRKALTKLMTSTHNLAVEVLRWKQRKDGSPISREERLCRFCHECVEDEVHAVWDCMGSSDLLRLRQDFLSHAIPAAPLFQSLVAENGVAAINVAADSSGLCVAFARLVYGVLETFDSAPVYIPDQTELEDCVGANAETDGVVEGMSDDDEFEIPDDDDHIEAWYS